MSGPKFNLHSLETLEKYFPAQNCDVDKLSFHRLKGFLTALSCAPETVPFADWWGALKALPELNIESDEAENELLPLVMTLMDKTLESVVSEQVAPPEPVELDNYDYGTSPIEQWSMGFMGGLELSEDKWFATEDEKEIEMLELSFGIVAMLANRESMRRKVDAEQFEERIKVAQKMLPQVVQKIYQMGKSSH